VKAIRRATIRGDEDLDGFATAPGPGIRLGLVYGRRRQGKSFLLRRLVEVTGGLYHMALEQERVPALGRFADTVAQALRLPLGSLTFDSWERALEPAVTSLTRKRTAPFLDGWPPVSSTRLPHSSTRPTTCFARSLA
jgi:uncharacterized protein